jgi:hypothetical protein
MWIKLSQVIFEIVLENPAALYPECTQGVLLGLGGGMVLAATS